MVFPGENIKLILENHNLSDASDSCFSLPNNLFEMPSVNNDDEYIGIINEEYRNPKAIANLINYLAETYKIDNDIATKKSFAFRLTGRLRPKDDEFVRVIHWKTEDTQNYSIYAINSTPMAKGRWQIQQDEGFLHCR